METETKTGMMSRQVEECPELPATTRSRKPGKANYPLGLPEGANPDGILISDFQLMERGQKPFVASLATLPWGVFYASSRKLIHGVNLILGKVEKYTKSNQNTQCDSKLIYFIKINTKRKK